MILVPVRGRPHRVAPLLRSIAQATPEPYRVVFLADPDDEPQLDALAAAGADTLVPGGNYAEKIHHGVVSTSEPLIFTGADDLEPQEGWLDAAAAELANGAQVVGVNDLIERRSGRQGHATHFLMTREYAELPTIDGRPGPFFTGYGHNFCDDELIATARKRGVYAYAEDCHVRHLHPMNQTAPDDPIYQHGRALFRIDRRRFHRRAHLWT